MQGITKVSSATGIQDICGRATYDRRTCCNSQTTLINTVDSPKVPSDAPIHN